MGLSLDLLSCSMNLYFCFCASCCCCSVTKLCLILCDPMDCNAPGFPVLHCLPEVVHTSVHRVGDAIWPSHLLLPLSPLRPLWASAILYCSFVVYSEVSEPDCSSSVFLSEDCFGFQGPLCFHTICKIKILWKMLLVIWWALHYSSRLPWIVQSFWQYWVFQRTLYISPSVCTIFDFFHQGLTDFWVQVICPLR